MSYILEALKKSEQERERGSVPDIKSVHNAESPAASSSKSYWWWTLLVVVLLVNGAIFAVVYLDEQTPDQQIQEVDTGSAQQLASAANATTNNDKPKPQIPAKTAQEPLSAKSATSDEKAEQPTPRVVFSKEPLQLDDTVGNVAQSETVKESSVSEQSTGVSVEPEPMLVSELPDSVRKQIPQIAFEGHVYSSSPERRSVMINGKKMREGDAVSADLLLKEITPTAAEFEIQGYRFKLDALQDWSYR